MFISSHTAYSLGSVFFLSLHTHSHTHDIHYNMGREKMAFSMKTRYDKVDETDSMQIIEKHHLNISPSFSIYLCFSL
jgi:hypothetical protein